MNAFLCFFDFQLNNPVVQQFLRKRNIRQELIRAHEKNAFSDFYSKTIQVMLKMQMFDAPGELQSGGSVCVLLNVRQLCILSLSLLIFRHRSESMEREHQVGRLCVQLSAERSAELGLTVGNLAGQVAGKRTFSGQRALLIVELNVSFFC